MSSSRNTLKIETAKLHKSISEGSEYVLIDSIKFLSKLSRHFSNNW